MADNKANDNKEDRTRDWTFILYPESAPADWKEILKNEYQVSAIISPLHDKDVLDDVDRTSKKAHYHIILRFQGKKSFKQIKMITDALNQPIPQPVKSIEGAVRYMAHLDSPDKAQYDTNDIEVIGNIDIEKYFKMTDRQKDQMTLDIIIFINENNILELSDLIDYCSENNNDWFRHLCTNVYLIDKYITSRRNKYEKTHSVKMNEIINALNYMIFGEKKE